ncbi:MAG: hypothetical protein QXJ53_03480 [Candidatus Bathyarchaeia archaeon]
MGLYEELSESYPEEETDFGLCLLIPHSAFKPEWSEQLKAEGVKVFQQSYNGRLFFFLKKPNSNNQTEAAPTFEPSEQPKELKPIMWNEQTFQLIEKLQKEGLGYRRIAEKLREMGIKTNPTSLLRKMKEKRGVADKPKTEALNCEGENDGLFKEYLEASRLLYPKFKRATALLLREASRVLENG